MLCSVHFVRPEQAPSVLQPHTLPLPSRRGERFDRGLHVSGTEVKAITYSALCPQPYT